MAELNDEAIASVLQDKDNFDSLLDKSSSSSSSFDTLLKKYPLKSDNQKNPSLDDGSSSDDGAVKSVRKRIKRFSDSDSEVEADKENIQSNLTPSKETIKPHIPSESEDLFPRKSRLVANDSSDEDITSSKNEGMINEKSKNMGWENTKNRSTSPEKVSKSNGSSDSEDDIFSHKSRLVFSDSSDDNVTSKNESTRKSKKSNLSPRKASKSSNSLDNEDDVLPRKSRLASNADSSDDNSRSSRKSSNSSKMRSPGKTHEPKNLGSEDDKIARKSRLVANEDSSDDNISSKNESARISDKKSKLHNKFKGLLKSRSKGPESQRKSPSKSSEEKDGSNTDDSGSGIESIKQKIKQKSMLLKSGICDPDTSSEEESAQAQKQRKKKPRQKSTIMISPQDKPKPARMSAKQAMENMQRIRSESNRMLREKEVSLPYHRPKALSLKDIMNRRRPALSADGKALPVKMNSEQLKQYVKLLEQRNKEMMELCRSESEEEEETNDTPTEDNRQPVLSAQGDMVASDENNVPQNDNKFKENTVEMSVNETEEMNENELPDLTVELVRKGPYLSEVNIVDKDLSNINSADKDLSNADAGDKNMSNTFNCAKYVSNNDIAEQDVETKDASEDNFTDSEPNTKLATVIESQLMELRYETEKVQNTEVDKAKDFENSSAKGAKNSNASNDDNSKKIDVEDNKDSHENVKDNSQDADFDDDFDDVDINMEDLESIIDNAKDNNTAVDSPMLIRDPYNLNKKPKLTGAPGMVIDLDGSNPVVPRKLTGVELLKERFTYFSKLKTPEEKERERELTIKPGMQHLKLKQELEEKISEQRSLEWAKRLEEEKQQHEEMNALMGDDSDGDDLEKIEAKLEEKEDLVKESSSESEEEELEEDDCDMKDKPRKKNAMIDDEAEVSEDEEAGKHDDQGSEGNVEGREDADNEDEDEESEESSDESSDEDDNQSKPKKGRILKAFEDSDDEGTNINENPVGAVDSSEDKHVATDSQIVKDSQDDVIPLAQANQSLSEDLFGSQTSCNPSSTSQDIKKNSDEDCADMTTQTFSIMNTNTQELSTTENVLCLPTNIDVIYETQPIDEPSLNDVVGMCSGKFTQTQNVPAESQLTESQCPIGEDVLALCTGKFYSNQFVSQEDGPEKDPPTNNEKAPIKKHEEKDLLELKKRKLEKRALQISDDEDEVELLQSDEAEDYMSEVDEDNVTERIVEYDSEENEIVRPQKQKKSRKLAEFFENEAELTSEDEWVGSGDEDERGLDRMEREEGDDDTFHQGQLQRELGQIHMRDVLDQDKREVRLIQELLFEDGDLGDGGRQRKFRWKNLDGEDEPGTVPELFAESQEEEFESEEQWRKQRHEREVFLRNLKEKETEQQNTSIDRSTIIKANLCSRTMSSLLMEANGTSTKVEQTVVVEKKVLREEPTRTLPLQVFQQNYHGSLLTRGRGSLARLAALAMPLAGEADDQPKPAGPSSKRNFVFAAVTPPAKAKAPKRKADNVNIGSPRLIKKFKNDEKKFPKASLLDHLKAL